MEWKWAQPALELHTENGTELICGLGVDHLDGGERVERLLLTDGTAIPAQLVIVGIGVSPNVEWLESTDLVVSNGVRPGRLEMSRAAARYCLLPASSMAASMIPW